MIPTWNISGVLPPIQPGEAGHSPHRSPYVASMYQVVERFATSAERAGILQGLMDYRHELYLRGIVAGFQWLDGSFLEEIEALESPSPNDVDVVTFFSLPEGTDQRAFAAHITDLFDHEQTKQRFHVDAYPFLLAPQIVERGIRQITYWYSMWSHRRDGIWKGFVQVDLSPREDETTIVRSI